MSTAFTPSGDLILQPKIPQVPSLFTTFSTGHFVKPSQYTQPVKATELASFAGCYTEVYACDGLDLDYDEPNAVSEEELQMVQAGSPVHQIELPVIDGVASNEISAKREVAELSGQKRTAA